MSLKNQLLVGYSATGKSVRNWLLRQGQQCWVYDDTKVDVHGIVTVDFIQKNINKITRVIRSPGFPREHMVIQMCTQMGIPIVTDMHLAAPFLNGKRVFVVSGTDGKSSVVYFLEQMLIQLGETVVSCGNNEIPILTVLEKIEKSTCVIIELSSFMLEYRPPIVASSLILTNVSPDHLNRYKDFATYVSTKKNSFLMVGEDSFYIQNTDDDILREDRPLLGKVIQISENKEKKADFQIERVSFDRARYLYRSRGREEKVAINICVENYAKAWNIGFCLASLWGWGYPVEKINCSAIQSLPYRLERLHTKRKVRVYNDAKSTTIGALFSAIKSFDENDVIHIILGGDSKKQSFYRLERGWIRSDTKKLYCMGKNAEKISKESGIVNVLVETDIQKCVELVWERIQEGEILLFSPACASEAPFKNYRERGKWFEEIIQKLDKKD